MDLTKAGNTAFPLQFVVQGPATDPITGATIGAGHSHAHVFTGMTLRDYFAAKFMQGFVAAPDRESEYSHFTKDECAKRAYQMADAMLAARGAA